MPKPPDKPSEKPPDKAAVILICLSCESSVWAQARRTTQELRIEWPVRCAWCHQPTAKKDWRIALDDEITHYDEKFLRSVKIKPD